MKWKKIAISMALGLFLAFSGITSAWADTLAELDNIAWASIRNYTSQQFSDYFDQKRKDGYRVTDIEVAEINGQPRYSAIWQFNSDRRGWASLRDLTSEEFSQRWNEFQDQGYRLIDQEAYTLNGQLRYAGVWEENKEKLGWASYRNVSSAEFSDRFNTYKEQGYRMVDIEAYPTGNTISYSAIWVKNPTGIEWAALRDLSASQYATQFQSFNNREYRVLDLESYLGNGQQQYAAIFIKNDGKGWKARRDMDDTTYSNWWKTYRDEGYRLVDFEVYPTAQGTRYAGVWRQNGDRLNWVVKKDVDDAIVAYQDKFDVPGLSVAIARDGKLVYTRGFGFANLEQKQVAHSGTIFRLASVSKPITNALTMRLVDQNRLSLDQASRFYVPDLPQQHTHTVRQLMTHQSGIRHYKGSKRDNCEVPNNPNWKDSSDTQYPTATEATKLFRNDPLMFTPGEKTCYSTHAFTALGAALEGASKVSFPALVNRELTQGLDLPTLRPEVLNQGNPERAAIYKKDANNKNVLSNLDNLSWKYPGGGLESSSVDLAQFGMKILDGSFLSTPALNELGWQSGVRSFTGSQNGAHSNLRLYPNNNLVIAILSNQSGHNPGELGKTLGDIVLKAE